MVLSRLAFGLFLLAAPTVSAHEFWIAPEEYQVETGASVKAHLRNGEDFNGISLAWFDNRFTRFDTAMGGETHPVAGRLGDTPALSVTAPDTAGLMVIVHETTPSSLTYNDWEKFLRFARHKDFTNAEADHIARGWPQEAFRESYTRHAKALVAVGNGAGTDRAFGLETEFVALSNPYTDAGDTIDVALYYAGAPRADAQVEIFERAPDGSVDIRLTRTDANGVAQIAVSPGHDYLLDAVVLRPSPEAGASETAPVWETLWAALTFHVPQ